MMLPATATNVAEVNNYVSQVSNFINQKCNGCQSIIILGDDYVVPQHRNDYWLENGFPFLGWKLFKDPEKRTILTDNTFIVRKVDFKISELQSVFNNYKDGEFVSKPVLLIAPVGDSELLDAADRLKATIENAFGDAVTIKSSSDIYCDELNRFNENQGKTLVIIGTPQNNRAFACYPSVVPDNEAMYIDVNVWDPDHPALVIKTEDPWTVDFYSVVIDKQLYLQIDSPKMTVLDKVILGSGIVLVVVGVGLIATGAGAPVGAVLTIIGVSLDVGSGINECWINNEGGGNWGDCELSVGFSALSPLIGKYIVGPLLKEYGAPLAKYVVENIRKLTQQVDPVAVERVIKEGTDWAESAKHISDGMAAAGKTADEAISNAPTVLDDAGKARFFRTSGEVLNNVKIVEWQDVVTQGTKVLDDVPLSQGGIQLKQAGQNAGDIISFETFSKRGMKLLKLEKGANGVQYVTGYKYLAVDYLGSLGGKKFGVQVKRIADYTADGIELPLTENKARDLVTDGLTKLNGGKSHLANAGDAWDHGVFHALVRLKDKPLLDSVISSLPASTLGDSQIVITVVDDVDYIWRNK